MIRLDRQTDRQRETDRQTEMETDGEKWQENKQLYEYFKLSKKKINSCEYNKHKTLKINKQIDLHKLKTH